MNMKRIMQYLNLFVLSGILLLSVGCSGSGEEGTTDTKSESKENIRAVLKTEFNGPSKELEKIWRGSSSDKLRQYKEEHFKPYVSESFFERFAVKHNSIFEFLRIAHPDYELKVEDIAIKEAETIKNAYDFTAEVSYSKNGSDESKTIEMKGYMKTNEEGKVVSINHFNYEEFQQALK